MHHIRKLICSLTVTLFFTCLVSAQSTDIATPSPVVTNEVSGTIPARDIGDARLTDHFYAFTGTPGDLLITVDSRNMDGDVDVFTANGLRPLLKFTMYSGTSGPTTKSVYLRQTQSLILRVEARTPNDEEAIYRIHFGGAFAALEGVASSPENELPTAPAVSDRSGKKGRRVSSVGARIDEPAEPVAVAAATPEPTPEVAESPKREAPQRTSSRGSRTRRPPRNTKRTEAAKKEPAATAPDETAAKPPEETAAEPTENKPATARRRGSKRNTTARAETANTPTPEALTGPRLVIETSDGTLIDRYMSTVRRVTVENGVVVVTGKDGKIDRIPLATVVRMTIAN